LQTTNINARFRSRASPLVRIFMLVTLDRQC
jgi:hypothetical protein